MNTVTAAKAEQASGRDDKSVGRLPERSAEAAGNEATGLTPISTQKSVQPGPVDPSISQPIVSQPILSAGQTSQTAAQPIVGRQA